MKKKGAAYQKMLLSFIVVFCLPLCLMVLFYFYSEHVMEEQIELSNENLLQTVQSVCDQEIQFYKNILLNFSADATVKELGSLERTKGTEYEQVEELEEKLLDSLVSIGRYGGMGNALFVYFNKLDMVVSTEAVGLQRFTTYCDEYYSRNPEDREDLSRILSTETDFSESLHDTRRWGEDVLLLTRTCWRRAESCEATVGIWLDSDMLSRHVSSIDWKYGFDWVILDENDRVIKGAENIAFLNTLFDPAEYADGETYFVSTIHSEITNWQYVLLVPRQIIEDSAGQIRVFFFVSLALSVLLGYFVTRKIAVMNYAPLEKLMGSFQSKSQQDAKNEYRFLQEQVSTLLSSRTDMQKTISRSGDTMKKWALVDLLVKLHVPQSGNPAVEELMRSFSGGQNIVLLIREKITDAQPDQEESDNLKMFIIDNVFNEKVGEVFYCQMVELDGRQVLIVNDPELSGREEKLWEIVYNLQEIIQEYFELSITVAAGGKHRGLEGIHESYLEAREAEEFIPVLEQDCITYDEIKDNTLRKYDYSIQAEERVISAILNNDVELAVAFIDKILELNFTENRTTSNMRRCLLLDLYCTLLKAADEKGCIERINVSQNSFSIKQPVQELKDRFARLVEQICKEENQESETGSDKELCQRVLAYVRANYSSPNLNISQVALHFHLTPSNLSTIFKKETGRSLLKVINEVRIEYAVEFLRQGCSVVETAEKIGITESSSFIRLFKKHMGVTPGQMKAHLKKNTENGEDM